VSKSVAKRLLKMLLAEEDELIG